MKSAQSCKSKEKGFTLVELMIAMAVGGIVMAAVMTSFIAQHRSYVAQDDVIEMQQNARVAMEMLTRDIRSAGYDTNELGAGVTTAGPSNLVFTRDDGTGVLERISYSLFDAFIPDADNDGLVDDLSRTVDTGFPLVPGLPQVVAENVSQLEFVYLDKDGVVTANLGDIRSIQVSIMMQSAQIDTKSNPPSMTYTTPSGAVWNSTPGYRSRYLSTTVNSRNLGL